MVWQPPHVGVYNPVHGHYVILNKQRIFLGNHYNTYKRYWTEGAASFSDHAFL